VDHSSANSETKESLVQSKSNKNFYLKPKTSLESEDDVKNPKDLRKTTVNDASSSLSPKKHSATMKEEEGEPPSQGQKDEAPPAPPPVAPPLPSYFKKINSTGVTNTSSTSYHTNINSGGQSDVTKRINWEKIENKSLDGTIWQKVIF
jgi:hypothetical protein